MSTVPNAELRTHVSIDVHANLTARGNEKTGRISVTDRAGVFISMHPADARRLAAELAIAADEADPPVEVAPEPAEATS